MIKGLFGVLLFFLPFLVYELHQGRGTHYGAIAISKNTMQFGTSDHHPSRKKAEEAALAVCREGKSGTKPEDCKIGVWFYDACGALAIDPHEGDKNDGSWGAQWAGTEAVAEKKALENCEQHSRRAKCTIVTTFCSL